MDIVLYFVSAFILGAGHALEPGHGKTVVGAYLVGSRGRAIDAILLGVIVTLAHTAGVFALGGLALFASAYVSQQAISRFLQLPSGLLVLIVGLYVLRDAWRMFQHGSHNHQHVHRHDDPAGSDTPPSLGLLVTLGISGGLVPCPTALAILLAAIGDGRVTLGLLSVIVFSLGLTVVLVAIGLVMVSATALAHDHLPGMGLARWARLASGLIVTGLGVYLVVEAFIYQGWWR